MVKQPQEYVTPEGQVTTNNVQGFHGLTLKYQGKRVDLNYTHYIYRTSMAICHKIHMIYIIIYLYKVSCIESRSIVENYLFMEDGC